MAEQDLCSREALQDAARFVAGLYVRAGLLSEWDDAVRALLFWVNTHGYVSTWPQAEHMLCEAVEVIPLANRRRDIPEFVQR